MTRASGGVPVGPAAGLRRAATARAVSPDRRAWIVEGALVAAVLVAQAVLGRSIHVATDYDEGVYLASVDLLRHGERLGSDVFAPQFPGFYDLLRGLAALFGLTVSGVRAGMIALALVATTAAWLVGRRFGGVSGGLLAASLLVVAPPLDLFAFRILADPMAIALMLAAAAAATFAVRRPPSRRARSSPPRCR